MNHVVIVRFLKGVTVTNFSRALDLYVGLREVFMKGE